MPNKTPAWRYSTAQPSTAKRWRSAFVGSRPWRKMFGFCINDGWPKILSKFLVAGFWLKPLQSCKVKWLASIDSRFPWKSMFYFFFGLWFRKKTTSQLYEHGELGSLFGSGPDASWGQLPFPPRSILYSSCLLALVLSAGRGTSQGIFAHNYIMIWWCMMYTTKKNWF